VSLIQSPFTNGQALVTARIGITEQRRRQLQAAGAAIPSPVPVTLLVDTGAALTALDEKVIEALALTPTGELEVHLAKTSSKGRRFDVSLLLPAPEGPAMLLHALPVFEGNFRFGVDGFLGRDVLAHCVLVYDGPARRFTLAF
jgi:hypothetical protein